MASLRASNLLFSSSSCCSSHRINAAMSVPKPPRIRFSPTKQPSRDMGEELKMRENGCTNRIPKEKIARSTAIREENDVESSTSMVTAQLYAILEAVADRVEMHNNIGEQRDNWNTLLLNSINMITLTAATMAGVASTCGESVSLLAFKLSSTLLFSAATGLLVIMNKIQPSQLAEEQRNAVRLFKNLKSQIETLLALRVPDKEDVKETMEKVLALDKAYPLPLLGGKMIEKFPKTFEPAVWWTSDHSKKNNIEPEIDQLHQYSRKVEKNGWSEDLELEMREIIEVIKTKDIKDYMRLGNLVLKINKILAISGPLLTGIAAVGSAFVGSSTHGSWATVVAVAAGALASAVNSFEHGAQVGMMLEMYRYCAGFFTLLDENTEANLNESEMKKIENGEMFEMKVALQLGRSTSQLRDLAQKSSYSRINETEIDEFASKLF